MEGGRVEDKRKISVTASVAQSTVFATGRPNVSTSSSIVSLVLVSSCL